MFAKKNKCSIALVSAIMAIMLLFLLTSEAKAKRRDQRITVSRENVNKDSIDYIGMTDLLATINTLYLNGYYGLLSRHIDEYNKKYPPVKEIFYFTAIHNINQRKYDEALHNLFIALTLEKGYSRAHNAIGYIYALRQQWRQSLSHFEIAQTLNRYNAFIAYNLGLVYYHSLNYEKAAVWAKKSIDDKPNFAPAFDIYACSMYHTNNLTKAVEYWGKALHLGLDNDRIYYNRACGYFGLGLLTECVNDCVAAVTKNKNNAEALKLLAYTYFVLNDYDRALVACNNALKIQKNDLLVKVLQAVCISKNNASAGSSMIQAILPNSNNADVVAVELLKHIQCMPVDPPLEFFLY